MKARRIRSFKWVLLRISVIPILVLTLVIALLSAKSFANSMNQEVKHGLQDISSTMMTMYDAMYEGNYSIDEQDGAIYFYKGDHLLNGNYELIDSIKEKTGVDITFFCGDTRVITTLCSNDNKRLIGTKASVIVVRDVLENYQSAFYPSVDINGMNFFAYYTPLLNSDGTCIGMIFAGKPSEEVDHLVNQSITPILLIALFSMLLTGVFTIQYSGQLINAIEKMELFLERVSNGNLHTELDYGILKREDEIGEMGRYIVKMQRSLRELVEQDLLTGLNNRRSAEKLLKQIESSCEKSGGSFCVAIGDIDHFKNVNDTYGHECGDLVLVDVSNRLKRHMKGNGFVARWGGEEFLLVFEDMDVAQAVHKLEILLDEIRDASVIYKETDEVKVTMTFGIAPGDEEKIDYAIRNADQKLYYGKNNGRNQIVQ